jgi:hypothetical protein
MSIYDRPSKLIADGQAIKLVHDGIAIKIATLEPGMMSSSHMIGVRLIERYNAGQDAIDAFRAYKHNGDLVKFTAAMEKCRNRAEWEF